MEALWKYIQVEEKKRDRKIIIKEEEMSVYEWVVVSRWKWWINSKWKRMFMDLDVWDTIFYNPRACEYINVNWEEKIFVPQLAVYWKKAP